ncbi:hypothetical protein [Vulcanisaeta distributa]|uniref:hypothetical protein n=1 Tax=Vulcanisaeta distributa TaxID=164451 RepID=UPI003CCB36F4
MDRTGYAHDIDKALNCRVVTSIPESTMIEGRENQGSKHSSIKVLTVMRIKPVGVDVKVNDGNVSRITGQYTRRATRPVALPISVMESQRHH